MELDRYTDAALAALIPMPAPEANKYSRGKLMAAVGSERFPGAACLAARAAERMGAGYVEVITVPDAVLPVRLTSPSLVVREWDDVKSGDWVENRTDRPCAYLVGCGFDPVDPEAERRTRQVLKRAMAPVVVDGGALATLLLDKTRRVLIQRAEMGLITVITPHLGEASRLARALGILVNDPVAMAEALARAYSAIAMVKGPVTCISNGNATAVMSEGTPALAKAGTGDVLAGMVGALLAQGLQPFDACMLASTLHARAGRAAAGFLTDVCVTADDVIGALPAAIDTTLAAAAPSAG